MRCINITNTEIKLSGQIIQGANPYVLLNTTPLPGSSPKTQGHYAGVWSGSAADIWPPAKPRSIGRPEVVDNQITIQLSSLAPGTYVAAYGVGSGDTAFSSTLTFPNSSTGQDPVEVTLSPGAIGASLTVNYTGLPGSQPAKFGHWIAIWDRGADACSAGWLARALVTTAPRWRPRSGHACPQMPRLSGPNVSWPPRSTPTMKWPPSSRTPV